MYLFSHRYSIFQYLFELSFYYLFIQLSAKIIEVRVCVFLDYVAELPSENPSVYTEKNKYSLGEKIRANCTSPPSFPAVNLTWFINGQMVCHRAQLFTSFVCIQLDKSLF